MGLINFTHFALLVMALVVVVTYGLNIGALSEADVLVNPKPDVVAELVMSSFILLLAGVAVVSVFRHMGAVQWFVEQRHVVLTLILSLVVTATYSLNLAILLINKKTDVRQAETGFTATLLTVGAVVLLYTLLRLFFGGYGAAGSALAARNTGLIKQMLGPDSTTGTKGSSWFGGGGSKPPPTINPLSELSSLIDQENRDSP